MSDLLQRVSAAGPQLAWSLACPETLPALAGDGFPRDELRAFFERGRDRPLVVVNDSARVIHVGLPQLLHELRGWVRELGVLVATGTHPGDVVRESERLGQDVEVHDCDDASAHTQIDGYGFDARVLEASCVLAIGSVEPHYFAGWTGAHKTLSVGVWDRATITGNHACATQVAARPMDTSDANPVAAGIRAGLRALAAHGPPVFALNHVLDAHGVPLAAGWGDPDAALARTTHVASQRCAYRAPEPLDVVVAEVEGPLRHTLYQADKGIKNHEAVVKDGGLLVLVADLDRGVGQDRFVRVLEQAPTLEAAQALLVRDGYRLGDHKALRWRALQARGVRVVVVSPHLDPAALRAAGVTVVPSLELALREAAGRGLAVQDAGFLASQLA